MMALFFCWIGRVRITPQWEEHVILYDGAWQGSFNLDWLPATTSGSPDDRGYRRQPTELQHVILSLTAEIGQKQL